MAIKVTIDDNFNNPKVKVLMLKGEKGDQGDLNHNDIVDNLTSSATDKVLSAKQGKVLNDAIGTKANSSDLTTTNQNVSALQTKINKKAYYFNNVASMKSANLVAGDYVITEGYYSANDGGEATYVITSTASQTDYQEELNNNLYATLIFENSLNIKQIGAYGDNSHDDTNIIKQAILKSDNIFIPKGAYKITDTIEISGNKNINSFGDVVSYVDRTKSAIIIKNKYNNIKLHNIVDQNSYNENNYDGGWHGWEDANYCGIEVQDLSYSNLEFNKIANFTTGIKMSGLTVSGTFKTKITGYEIFNCKYGIYFKTLQNSWVNNNIIEKIMINYGSASNSFHTSSNGIYSYGIYQEDVTNDTYGIRYIKFNNLFFETAIKDNFTAFNFNLINNSEFNMCIPEIKNGTKYANFDMKYIVADPVSPQNHSYQNKFNNCYVMGGNNDITFTNAGKVMCSLQEVAKHNDIVLNLVYKENNLLGKMVKIDNNHMSIKGYAFAPINATATNIDTCQISKSDYSYITNVYDKNCLNIGSVTPLSLIIPCNQYDTFKIVLNENGTSSSTIGNMSFKCFDANGDLLDGIDENNNKKLSGYFNYSSTYKNLTAKSGQINNIELSVVDENVKYILVYIYSYVNGFTIYKYGNPSIIKKFGNNLKHLYLLGNVAFSNVKPTSSSDTDSVIKNQMVYNSNSANLGEYWVFDGTSWN